MVVSKDSQLLSTVERMQDKMDQLESSGAELRKQVQIDFEDIRVKMAVGSQIQKTMNEKLDTISRHVDTLITTQTGNNAREHLLIRLLTPLMSVITAICAGYILYLMKR